MANFDKVERVAFGTIIFEDSVEKAATEACSTGWNVGTSLAYFVLLLYNRGTRKKSSI